MYKLFSKRRDGIIPIIILIYLSGCLPSKLEKVCFQDNCFYVELADTPKERTKGLMFRKKLAGNKGMLFIFEKEEKHSFWMKNTFIPLDIIWLNKDKVVVFLKKNAQPCQKNSLCPVITPDSKAMYVLELNAGITDDIGLKVGDKMDFYIK